MLFNKKREVKEFMKYEDGKIVSIEVEQTQKHKPIDHYQQETEPNIPLVEKTKIQAKQFFTPKRLKHIGLIIIFILFIFALYDVYKVFFVTTSDKGNTVDKGVVTEPITPPTTTESPGNTSVPTDKTKNGTTVTNPIEKPLEETISKSSIGELLNVANEVNAIMMQIVSKEINDIDSYHKKQANKIGLRNNLKQSQADKETIYVTLQSYKDLFSEKKMITLFEATERRLFESIAFTKKMSDALASDEGSTYSILEEYPKTDEDLQKTQQSELIKVLQENQIPYTVNDQLNEVQYTIK
ncbi:hypothetical protein ACFVS2_21120 [Brevibacillus sp. NPDC058079]|uniref:hypothetical protein n=1 Tax=Brevibacillus sp. NPDC058079 TaxID=3346330 RepID=UPI0036E3DE39